MNKPRICIVTPVYNDWESLLRLVNEISTEAQQNFFSIKKFIIINDGSNENPSSELIKNNMIDIINLSSNVGHQRSIAIGLCTVNNIINDIDFVIVMDSDGEDSPKDISGLIKYSLDNSCVVFASREKRSESRFFKINYVLYKRLFRLLTKTEISFGNFSSIPKIFLDRITSNPDLWNHFSGSIIKSKINYKTIPTERGSRYYGSSKMNFTNLVTHGLSSIAIFIDVIIVRLLVFNFLALVFSFIVLLSLLFVKIFTNYEIPGWTPIYTLGFFNILIFSLIFILLLVLIQLSNRSVVKDSPKVFYKNFILNND